MSVLKRVWFVSLLAFVLGVPLVGIKADPISVNGSPAASSKKDMEKGGKGKDIALPDYRRGKGGSGGSGGFTTIPEATTLILGGLAGAGIIASRLRRRKTKA